MGCLLAKNFFIAMKRRMEGRKDKTRIDKIILQWSIIIRYSCREKIL